MLRRADFQIVFPKTLPETNSHRTWNRLKPKREAQPATVFQKLRLMVQKSGGHQLRLVVYPHYLHCFVLGCWEWQFFQLRLLVIFGVEKSHHHAGLSPTKAQSSDEFAPNARAPILCSRVLSGDCSTHNATPREFTTEDKAACPSLSNKHIWNKTKTLKTHTTSKCQPTNDKM